MINFSNLLWKVPPKEEESLAVGLSHNLQSVDGGSDAILVPVEEVRVEPECRVVLVTDPHGPGADRFRYIRMRLREVKAHTRLRSLAITSPLPKDGKSTVTINLATALAEGGKRSVLVVEADLHHPTVARSLGIEPRPGLAECLQAGLEPLAAVRRLEPLSWCLLSAGEPRENPTELVQSDHLSRVLHRLSPLFDWILLDTPPVTPLADALSISRQVDASLLIVRADQTPRESVEEALDLLGRQHVLGIVFNGAGSLNRVYSKYHGAYGRK